MRLVAHLAVVISLTTMATASVSVSGKLTDGTGSVSKTAFLRFQLENCGANFPVAATSPLIVVQTQIDIRPNQPDGTIQSSILGNDEILCGNRQSTWWTVIPMKDQSHSMRDGLQFVVCSSTATLGNCGNTPGIFDPSTAQPMTVNPPPPGFTLVFSNPIGNQGITMLPGKVFSFSGTFDFTNATVTGLAAGGGGGGGNNGCTTNCNATSIQGTAVSGTAPNVNQVLLFNGTQYVPSFLTNLFLPLTGGTLTGPLIIQGQPTSAFQVANKSYVDFVALAKADLIGGLVPTAELGSGAANATTCLLGNRTWGNCGTGGSSFSAFVNGAQVSTINFNSTAPVQANTVLATFNRDSGTGNMSAGVPTGATSTTVARGDLAVQFDNLFGILVPGAAKVNQLQTTGNGPFTITGGFGTFNPAPAGKTRLGFAANGRVSVSENAGQVFELAKLDAQGNVSENALTATAFVQVPNQCVGNTFAIGVDISGNGNCAQPLFSQIGAGANPNALSVSGAGSVTYNGGVATAGDVNANNLTGGHFTNAPATGKVPIATDATHIAWQAQSQLLPTQIQLTVVAFASLPTCDGTVEGALRAVNDSNTNTWGASVAGGGANHILAYCDGSAWTVSGK